MQKAQAALSASVTELKYKRREEYSSRRFLFCCALNSEFLDRRMINYSGPLCINNHPVISVGCGMPSKSSTVGATSARESPAGGGQDIHRKSQTMARDQLHMIGVPLPVTSSIIRSAFP